MSIVATMFNVLLRNVKKESWTRIKDLQIGSETADRPILNIQKHDNMFLNI